MVSDPFHGFVYIIRYRKQNEKQIDGWLEQLKCIVGAAGKWNVLIAADRGYTSRAFVDACSNIGARVVGILRPSAKSGVSSRIANYPSASEAMAAGEEDPDVLPVAPGLSPCSLLYQLQSGDRNIFLIAARASKGDPQRFLLTDKPSGNLARYLAAREVLIHKPFARGKARRHLFTGIYPSNSAEAQRFRAMEERLRSCCRPLSVGQLDVAWFLCRQLCVTASISGRIMRHFLGDVGHADRCNVLCALIGEESALATPAHAAAAAAALDQSQTGFWPDGDVAREAEGRAALREDLVGTRSRRLPAETAAPGTAHGAGEGESYNSDSDSDYSGDNSSSVSSSSSNSGRDDDDDDDEEMGEAEEEEEEGGGVPSSARGAREGRRTFRASAAMEVDEEESEEEGGREEVDDEEEEYESGEEEKEEEEEEDRAVGRGETKNREARRGRGQCRRGGAAGRHSGATASASASSTSTTTTTTRGGDAPVGNGAPDFELARQRKVLALLASYSTASTSRFSTYATRLGSDNEENIEKKLLQRTACWRWPTSAASRAPASPSCGRPPTASHNSASTPARPSSRQPSSRRASRRTRPPRRRQRRNDGGASSSRRRRPAWTSARRSTSTSCRGSIGTSCSCKPW